ncbi:MAG TPA: SprB repeat-containing protein, partial [Ohtaekwangia sp.]|nr:SprB repeat-containing protein [Ohtaekwangia sp.]
MKRIILAFSFVVVALGLSHHAKAQCTGTPITNFALTNTVDVSCNGGNDGEIQVTFTGGEPPFSYSLVVVTGSGDIPIDNISNTTDQVVTFSGLYASAAYSGQYKVTVVTSNGGTPLALCKTRTIQNIDISEPSVLNLSTTGDIILACNGDTDGSGTFTASGGTAPYTFTVDANTTGGTTSTTATTLNLSGAGPGTITVTVTDANSCTNQAT